MGPASLFTALADGRRVENTLGDSGAQSDFAHPGYCRQNGVPILTLDLLHPSQQVAVKSVSAEGLLPQGFIVQRIQLPGIAAYDEDRIIYVWDEKVAALHDAKEMPLVLGTATLLRAFAVATESELAALSRPLQAARAALMLAGLVPRDKSKEARCLLQQVKQAEGDEFRTPTRGSSPRADGGGLHFQSGLRYYPGLTEKSWDSHDCGSAERLRRAPDVTGIDHPEHLL